MAIELATSVVQIILAICCAGMFVFFSSVLWRMMRSGRALDFAARYSRPLDPNAERSSVSDVALGRITVSRQQQANFAVQRAFVQDKSGQIVSRGRLSDEIIDLIK